MSTRTDSSCDLLVVGAGISGACLAFHAARAGRRVRVVEKAEHAGGCLASERTPSGFWYELAAHTCYNSYGALLEVLEGCGLLERLQERGKPVLRFLDGDRVVPGKNLFLLVKLFRKLEFLCAVPRWIGASQDGLTVRSYYSRLVGKRNYERVLGPMLSAVPSQRADDFPADMLFKRRERREDVMRSFTLPGGLRSAVEAALALPGIETTTGCEVVELARKGDGFAATLGDGSHVEARAVALAVTPGVATRLLGSLSPEASREAGAVREAHVESFGFTLRTERTQVPYSTFLIPLDDVFHSIVTRDVVPDPERRAFTIHFRPGLSREQKIQRACSVLGVRPEDLESVAERAAVLPSPELGHHAKVAALDRALEGERIAVTGNWFGGLSIEDCALRSRSEWERLAGLL